MENKPSFNLVSERLRNRLVRDLVLYGSFAVEVVEIDVGVRRRRVVDPTLVVRDPDGTCRALQPLVEL